MLPLKIQNGVGDARKEEIPRGLTTSRKQQIVFNLFQVFVVEFLGMVEVDMLLTPKSRSYHLGSDFRLRQVRQGITLCAEELFFPWSVMGSQALLHGLGTQALGEIEPDPSAVFHSVCFHPSPSFLESRVAQSKTGHRNRVGLCPSNTESNLCPLDGARRKRVERALPVVPVISCH